jgi:aldose 1-epimerase
MDTGIIKSDFGKTRDGRSAVLYTLTNANGLVAKITNYGGTMTQLRVPDRDGTMSDIVLGLDDLKSYEEQNVYFGCLVGRYCNRIARGQFTLDGRTYTLTLNNDEHHLHGGFKGFDKVIWNAEPIENEKGVGLKLTYLSKDMEEGYPGNLNVEVVYTLTHKDELEIDYTATTDKPTLCNLTNHNYYNLTGCRRDILGHELTINADTFTPVDRGQITTGQLAPVQGTAMDFTRPMAVGARISAPEEQILFGGGYNHTWVLNKKADELTYAATVRDPDSGRVMEVWTTEPGVHFYCGNYLDGTTQGRDGIAYKYRWGLCLETQHFQDSPNKPQFPTTVLRPGDVYKTKTVHKFYAL